VSFFFHHRLLNWKRTALRRSPMHVSVHQELEGDLDGPSTRSLICWMISVLIQ